MCWVVLKRVLIPSVIGLASHLQSLDHIYRLVTLIKYLHGKNNKRHRFFWLQQAAAELYWTIFISIKSQRTDRNELKKDKVCPPRKCFKEWMKQGLRRTGKSFVMVIDIEMEEQRPIYCEDLCREFVQMWSYLIVEILGGIWKYQSQDFLPSPIEKDKGENESME